MALNEAENTFIDEMQNLARGALDLYTKAGYMLNVAALRGYLSSLTDANIEATRSGQGLTKEKIVAAIEFVQAVLAAASAPNGKGQTGTAILIDLIGPRK